MKKVTLSMAVAFLVISFTSVVYAQYVKGYTVVSITEKSVTIKNAKGKEVEVPDQSGDFWVHRKVKYDKENNTIKPDLEGC